MRNQAAILIEVMPVYVFKDPSVGSVNASWKRVGERDCKQGTPWPHLSESSDGG